MPSKQSQKPRGRVKSSIALRLNLRLFLRLLGIYVFMDLLLLLLTGGGVLLWADRQCADVSALVEERGVPSAEATVWMAAGDYTVSALTEPPDRAGFLLNGAYFNLGSLRDDPLSGSLRTLDLGAAPFFFGPWTSHPGRDVTYTVALPNNGEPYAITLDLEHQVTLAVFAGRVLLICQLVSLLCNLFKNAGTIRRTLKPIQELAAAATRLGNASSMSPEELSALAGRLDEINATHLDKRIPVSGTQKELKTLAQAINAMLDRINEAYRSQMRFVSDASHELRTPISVIQGYANLLDRWGKDDPDTMQEAIDAIRSEADAMKELVEQLLFLARGDNDTQPVKPSLFDLSALAGEVLREEEMICPDRVFLPRWGEEPVPVRADQGLIKQVMRILMDNAIKYSSPGSRIYLRLSTQERYARLTVQDEGDGIPPESIPHIFERFYRTDQSRDRKTGGTGLGLSIARWIVERHEGWFEVVSRPGVGTRISFLLPLALPEQEAG